MHRLARIGLPFVFALLGCATGCATAPGTFGNKARFSPAFHGYVMATNDGSDDPARGETVLLLRDPLTGEKLRCEADVTAWRELHEDLAADLVEDENAAVAALVTTSAVFAPLAALHPAGALVLVEATLTAEMIYDDLSSDDATELFARGIVLHRRKRFARSAELIERALAKEPAIGVTDKALLYLGLDYKELGREERARTSLTLFLQRAAVRDVDAYREAERALDELGWARPTCDSTGPVELHW
jgi:tetratricopeptide (TPR) repeat protein